jgi:hypothetical protein
MCSADAKTCTNLIKCRKTMDIQVFDENGKALHIADVISRLKFKLEVNAGRLAEPLIKEGKQPKEDEQCHKAFLMLAHLEAIEDYINGL